MSHNKFSVVRTQVLLCKEINNTEKLAIALIEGLSNEKGYCFASNSYIADALGVSERQVQNIIKRLEDIGVLGRVMLINSKGISYRSLTVNPDCDVLLRSQKPQIPEHEMGDEIDCGGGELNFVGGRTTVRGGGELQFTHNNKINTKVNNKEVPLLPKETSEEEPQHHKGQKKEEAPRRGVLAGGRAAAVIESETEVSARAFAEWFKDNLWPKHIDVPIGYKKSWAEVYVKLHKTGKPKLEIADICKWARSDEFWSKNFLSPAKLIKKNKEGVLYYDVFKVAMGDKKPQEQTKHKSTGYNPVTGG